MFTIAPLGASKTGSDEPDSDWSACLAGCACSSLAAAKRGANLEPQQIQAPLNQSDYHLHISRGRVYSHKTDRGVTTEGKCSRQATCLSAYASIRLSGQTSRITHYTHYRLYTVYTVYTVCTLYMCRVCKLAGSFGELESLERLERLATANAMAVRARKRRNMDCVWRV